MWRRFCAECAKTNKGRSVVERVSTALQTVRIFLASSAELAEHRDAFDLHVRQLSDRWKDKGLYLQPVRWENFIDAMSATRLQDEYNQAVAGCDIFVMLFRTKVGKYTAEEFEKAFGQLKQNGKPWIYTYFHDAGVTLGSVDRAGMQSLWNFQDRLKALGHFQTKYETTDRLLLHFGEQLEKLHHEGHFGAALVSPAATLPAATQPTASQLIPYLQRRAAHWRSSAAGQLDRKFVNLTLLLDHGLEHDGPRHTEQGRYSLLSQVLEERRRRGRLGAGGRTRRGQKHSAATPRTAPC